MKIWDAKFEKLKVLKLWKFKVLKRNDNKLILEVLNFGNFAKYIIWWWNILGNWLSEKLLKKFKHNMWKIKNFRNFINLEIFESLKIWQK